MTRPLTLLGIFAHPDDESLGSGSTLALYAAEGVDCHLVTATRGERGWFGDPADDPGMTQLGRIREAELRQAAAVLGLKSVAFLDYLDGDLDQAPPEEAIGRIVDHVRRVRPHVIVTFGPDGGYGHPDHIAVCQLTTAAMAAAADSAWPAAGGASPAHLGLIGDNTSRPHRVSKLYYMVEPEALAVLYERLVGEIAMDVDGVHRGIVVWPDWAITTRIDGTVHWRTAWQAVRCHRTQLPEMETLERQPDHVHAQLWGPRTYYRAYSLVNGGRSPETDLFEGLRHGS